MKTLFVSALVAVVALAPPGAAQDQDKEKVALATFEKIKADFQAQFATYRAGQKKIMATEAYKEARKAKDRPATMKLFADLTRPDAKGSIKQLVELEASSRGTDAGLKALGWIVSNVRGDRDTLMDTFDTAREHYLTHPQVGDFLFACIRRRRGLDEFADFVDEVIEKNPNKIAKANAYYARAQFNAPGRRQKGSLEYFADLDKAAELADGTELADRARAPKFRSERLVVGKEVPDIVGKDIDGKEFKLSDYRGKVILLDFWGDW